MAKQLLVVKLLPREAQDYEDYFNYFRDKWYHLRHTLNFKKDRTLAGYVTVRVRRAERDPIDPSKPLKDAQGNVIYVKPWRYVTKLKDNLLLTEGRDFVAAQVLTNTSAGTRGCGFIAVTSNTVAPAAGDTTLAGEITTNGLARADATTKTHTNDANASQFVHTFTASGGSHSNVQKAGTFNASSNGTMLHENTFTATTLADGDSLEITWNFTYG